jgi:F0F1-type ATP synthase assembly protein I
MKNLTKKQLEEGYRQQIYQNNNSFSMPSFIFGIMIGMLIGFVVTFFRFGVIK